MNRTNERLLTTQEMEGLMPYAIEVLHNSADPRAQTVGTDFLRNIETRVTDAGILALTSPGHIASRNSAGVFILLGTREPLPDNVNYSITANTGYFYSENITAANQKIVIDCLNQGLALAYKYPNPTPALHEDSIVYNNVRSQALANLLQNPRMAASPDEHRQQVLNTLRTLAKISLMTFFPLGENSIVCRMSTGRKHWVTIESTLRANYPNAHLWTQQRPPLPE